MPWNDLKTYIHTNSGMVSVSSHMRVLVWDISQIYLSLVVTRKPVFSPNQADWRPKFQLTRGLEVWTYCLCNQQSCWSGCVYVQADLCLCWYFGGKKILLYCKIISSGILNLSEPTLNIDVNKPTSCDEYLKMDRNVLFLFTLVCRVMMTNWVFCGMLV